MAKPTPDPVGCPMAASRLVRITGAVAIAAGAGAVAFVVPPVTFGDGFTADTTNVGSTALSGTVDMSNSFGGSASAGGGSALDGPVFVTATPSPAVSPPPTLATNLKPGDTRTVHVAIGNTGTLDANLKLTVEK